MNNELCRVYLKYQVYKLVTNDYFIYFYLITGGHLPDLKEILLYLDINNYLYERIKDIPYGKQIKVENELNLATINWYTSGKVVIQGKKSNFLDELNNQWSTVKNKDIKKEEKIPPLKDHIGTDEAGKGDYFGPIVIAGVFVKQSDIGWIKELGITDSKKLSDKKIAIYAKTIKQTLPYEIICLQPEKYNELYAKMNNLNKLLSWAHATVIENLWAKSSAKEALIDKFCSKSMMDSFLKENTKKHITVYMVTKAERDTAVACASVLARDAFVQQIDSLEKKYDSTLSKGASSRVISNANVFIDKHGYKLLDKVAKLHFKTTEQLNIN